MTSALAAWVDCSTMRLGDRMACAWLAQQRRRHSGERFGLVDVQQGLAKGLALPFFFPDTFEALTPADVARLQLPAWDMGNLWLTATNAFASQPQAGHFEALPPEVQARAQHLVSLRPAGRPRVLVHVLDDAPYNRSRNWHARDTQGLLRGLTQAGLDVVRLNPATGQFLGGLDEMLAQMLAADAFVGGDTGPSHVFALLCPDKPQLALYPDMGRDQRRYAAEQQRLGLARPWSSLPLRPGVVVSTLRRRLTLRWQRGWPELDKVGRFDPQALVRQVLAGLALSPAEAALQAAPPTSR